MTKASLYFHIPFCVKKCVYCDFFSKPCQSAEIMDAYSQALIQQLSSAPICDVSTIYFGGGTPSLLGYKNLVNILNNVFEHFNVDNKAEITLEINPKTIDYTSLSVLRKTGFNRLSAGLQSADDTVLKVLGRIHSAQDFLVCYTNASNAGFDNISVDIMFSLPNSNPDSLAKTVEFVKAIKPKHISAYSLILEEKTSLFRNKNEYSFMNEDEEEAEYSFICNAFQSYKHYEISAFALNGYESRHNLNYWRRGEYLGFGAGAHSFYRNRRFAVPSDIEKFIRSKNENFLTSSGFYDTSELKPEETEEERIMLGLRMRDGIILNKKQLRRVEKYAKNGLAVLTDGRFALTEKGFRFSNKIISDILL